MSQPSYWGILTEAMDALATPQNIKAQDDECFDALLSAHSGAARPAYAVAGTIWHNSTDGRLYMYDGAADAELIRRVAVPASAVATGLQGQIAYDASYLYLCTATNTWVRVAVATW